MNTPAQLGLSGWHGLTWHPVTVIGETPTKYRIRLEEAVRLPGGREKAAQEEVFVPKQAVRFSRDTAKTSEASLRPASPRDWPVLRDAVSVDALARARYGEPDQRKSTRTTLQWTQTDQGRLIVGIQGRYQNAWRFMDSGVTGKGAIDWLVKAEGLSLREAAEQLSNTTFVTSLPPSSARSVKEPKPYHPIPENPALWPPVRAYLIEIRKLPAHLVDHWHETGKVRALTPSSRTVVPYAAFPLMSPAGHEVGAVLRCAGTPDQQRQQITAGFSPKRNQGGSQPTQGFWQSHEAPQAHTLVLVEAPIDGMALYAALLTDHRDPSDFVIRASAGEALKPVHWTGDWAHIVTAFDRDAAGERFHHTVRQAHPDHDVRRLTPPVGHKDWGEAWAQWVSSRTVGREPESDYEPGD